MNSSVKLPVLVYHQIVTDGVSLTEIPVTAQPYCLYRSKFIEQLEYLHINGYKVITVSAVSGLKENNVVAVTFDDGLESDYFISFPELDKRGFRATFYIITDCVGKRGYMDWEQIRELRRSGLEIGSHSVTHPCLIDLDRQTLFHELTQSKNVIEENLGESIESFGVPYGFVNRNVIETIIEAGYTNICTSKTELADPKAIPKIYGRYGIRSGDSMKTFKGIIGLDMLTLSKIQLKEQDKNFLKRFMGRRIWLTFRENVLSRKKIKMCL